jgi:molybdenum cofactor cytidylyltransferase
MGTPKQLLPFGGKPLVRHSAEVALAAFQPLIAVVGAGAAEVEAALAGLPVQFVHNALWEHGVGTSIQAGVRRAAEIGLEGVVLLPADQPLVTADHLRALRQSQGTSGKPIVASRYAGTVGVPVLFSRQYFPHLLQLAPTQGCKGIITSNEQDALLVDCQAAEFDIDTPGDYASLASTDAGVKRIRAEHE